MTLHVHTFGHPSGRPVLLLHGFMGSGRDWAPVAAALGTDCFCLAPDLPGHGRSVDLPVPEAYTMAGTAGQLDAVLRARGVHRATVVGYSMGGRLALYFALKYPGWCSGLVLESASPGLRTEAERAERRTQDEARAIRLETGSFDDFLTAWYQLPLFATLRRHPEARARMLKRRRQNQPVELARSLRYMGTGSQPSLWDELHTLQMPCLVLAGAEDTKFTRIGRAMTAAHPESRFVQVPDAGHNIHLACMKAYITLLKPFIVNPGEAP